MPLRTEEKFDERDLLDAVGTLSTMRYFPQESRAAVMEFLAKICPHKRALRWTVDTLIDHATDWPGLAEVRGVLCTKFDAADGVDRYCGIPGLRPVDFESKHVDRHLQLTGKSAGYEEAGPKSEAARGQGGFVVGEAEELLRQLAAGMNERQLRRVGGAKQ